MSSATRTARRLEAPQSTERAVPAPSPAPAEPAYELVDIDRYVVQSDGPVGYVEVIPPLFICYTGHPYPRAVEVAQVFDFKKAVSIVIERAEPTQSRRSAA